MKHFNNYACMLALISASAAGFTACSSDEVPNGGTNGGGAAGQMVKTSFALNIPSAGKSARMTADMSQGQENPGFRGISDMRLLAFVNDPSTEGAVSTKKIVLGNTNNDAFQSDNQDGPRRVYRDVTIPVGTSHFLFYGTATETAEKNSDATEKFKTGILNASDKLTTAPSTSTNAKDEVSPSDVTFSLETISSADFNAENNDAAKAVLKALNDVYGASFAYNDDNGQVVTEKWSELTAGTTCKNMTTAQVNHAVKMFAQFKTLSAGSSNSVKKVLESLKASCGVSGTVTNPTNLLEAIYKACDEALTSLESNSFPNNMNLPDGAAQVKLEKGSFKFKDAKDAAIGKNNFDYTKATYPASLNYFVNTPVKANDKALNTIAEWPEYKKWNSTDYTWDAEWKDAVGVNTHSIALKNAIQYGVADLVLTIKANAASLDDNAKEKGGELADRSIDVAGKLTMTGVLVGGQPSVVGWDYLPTSSASYDYTVYDRYVGENGTGITVNTTQSSPNYTLVLDNNKAEQANTVYITVELVNNTGSDFYGADGLVPNGGKFYLVGKLDTQNATAPANGNKDDYHIFMKDHKTVANLTITNLQKAHNCIPDLRSTQISLGLAVDLTWQNGLTFSVDL